MIKTRQLLLSSKLRLTFSRSPRTVNFNKLIGCSPSFGIQHVFRFFDFSREGVLIAGLYERKNGLSQNGQNHRLSVKPDRNVALLFQRGLKSTKVLYTLGRYSSVCSNTDVYPMYRSSIEQSQ